jgi:hypothetical protein
VAVVGFLMQKFTLIGYDGGSAAEAVRKAFAGIVGGVGPFRSHHHLVHGALTSAVLSPGAPTGVDWCFAEALMVRVRANQWLSRQNCLGCSKGFV